ncbi:hypothetical protein V865_007897 [Kwoniella europaea PYCC6329]|uniref:Uncharacterized protein n=1 Tax=Kwoniella europaea PYCC6329 TaxID=1423913 RepID=A0AAX4KU53_9TREE
MEESATSFALSVEQVAQLGTNKLVVFSKSNQLAKCREERHGLYLQEIWTKLETRGYATHHKISDLTRSGGRGMFGCLVVIDDRKYKLSVHEFTYKSHWQIVGLYDLLEWINKLEFQYQLFQWAELPATYIPQLPMGNSDFIELLKKDSVKPLETILESAKTQFSVHKLYEDLMEAKTSMDHLAVRRSSSISTCLSPSSVSSASSKVQTCSNSDTSSEQDPLKQEEMFDTPYLDTSSRISSSSPPIGLSTTQLATPLIPLSPTPRPRPRPRSSLPCYRVLRISRNGKIRLAKGLDILVRRAIRLGKKRVVYEGQVYNISKIVG